MVKVKVQNRIANVLCDVRVYDALPVKSEAKVVLSGLYITEIRSIRGGAILQPEKIKTLWQRFEYSILRKKVYNKSAVNVLLVLIARRTRRILWTGSIAYLTD